jgi:hypothetical protein
VLDRCHFACAAAEDLSPIEEESADVVTTRSVLIYVEDKRRRFYRIPSGFSDPMAVFRCSSRSTA